MFLALERDAQRAMPDYRLAQARDVLPFQAPRQSAARDQTLTWAKVQPYSQDR